MAFTHDKRPTLFVVRIHSHTQNPCYEFGLYQFPVRVLPKTSSDFSIITIAATFMGIIPIVLLIESSLINTYKIISRYKLVNGNWYNKYSKLTHPSEPDSHIYCLKNLVSFVEVDLYK